MKPKLLTQYLSDDGAELETLADVNMIGDYSVTPKDFYLTCPAGKTIYLARIIIYIKDASGFTPDVYGSGSALSNGITMKFTVDSEEINLTPLPIKTNDNWKRQMFDDRVSDYGVGPTNDSLAARWSFFKHGLPRGQRLGPGDKITATLNDSFTFLLEHTILGEGVIFDEVNDFYDDISRLQV
jgi:hypothetical protein